MNTWKRFLVVIGFAATASSLSASEFKWPIPAWIAPPKVPASNPMSPAKVELGRRLFYDIRLSGPGYMSCASCHKLERGLTDGRKRAIGSTGESHSLNTPQIANVGYQSALTFSDPTVHSLEQQALLPLFGIKPIEMGASGLEHQILSHIAGNAVYEKLFSEAFPGSRGKPDFQLIAKALAAFQRTLISANSRYDQYKLGGQKGILSAGEKRGEQLFKSVRLGCAECHKGIHFTDAIPLPRYHNTGLYNVDGKGGLPDGVKGLIDHTGVASDMGKFKTPSLRNISVSAPYMHDGSVATLDEVILHYEAGGRSAQQGSRSPLTSPLIRKFSLSSRERSDLIAFLKSLTDEDFLNDARLSSPFK
ncbi:MAG: MbnH family di-heme enzyme [Pseudomonadota bacterium]